MSEEPRSVSYREPEAGYFESRNLKKYAGVFSLWALGVGAVISGDFSGWNLGVGQAGFGGFLIAVVIITAAPSVAMALGSAAVSMGEPRAS